MDEMFFIPVGIVVVGLIVYLIIRHEKKRREALRERAQTLGFTYTKKAGLDEIGKAREFHLFNVGHSKRIRNLMARGADSTQTRIYDYRYTTGGGQHSHTHMQTVFQFESSRLKLPAFIIRPENIFHKIGKSFGYKDIDFEAYPEFSKKYLLRGEDEEAIRKLFNQELIIRFEAKKGLIVEGKGPLLICYRSSKRVRPDDLWIMYESMQALCKMFIQRCETM